MSTKLESQWIVGFTDGEGCFNLDVHLNPSCTHGIQIQPEFTIVQGDVDVQVLEALKDHFQCGSVCINRKDATSTRMMYRVKNLQHCHDIIIPFFEAHKLKTKKGIEFQRFREIVILMKQGYHTKSLSNFLEIVEKGVNLRVRQRPANLAKRGKVNDKLDELRAQLAKDPTL